MKKHTNTLSAPTASTAALLLLLLTLTVGACRPDELMTDDGGTLPPGSNGNPGIPASVCIVAGELPAYTEPAHTATRTTPEGNAWADGDVVTAYISYYSDEAGTQPIDIDGTGTTTAVQTLTFKAAAAGSGSGTGAGSGTGTPAAGTWTAQPLVLPLPAGLRSLRVSYRHTGAEDVLTGTSEFVTGHLAQADYPNSPSVLERVPEGRGRSSSVLEGISHIQPPADEALKAILHPTDPATLDPSSLVVISDPTASITLPAPVWTRRTARVIVKAVQAGQTVIANVPRLATLSATRTAPTADSPAPTAADAVFHLLVPKTPLSPDAPAGTPDGFTLFDADLGPNPADASRMPLYRDVAYAPGQTFLVSATGLHPGAGGGDQQGTVKGSGLSALDEDLFCARNPTWIVSGGGTDKVSADTDAKTKDATVLGNVRTALDKIFNPDYSTNYAGTDFIDLTLTEVTTLPERRTSTGAFERYKQLRSVSLPAADSIGAYAFYGCTALTSVSLPQATDIGERAFFGCNALTSISLPEATDIGTYAFQNCTALTSAYLPAATSIGQRAFDNCTALTSISLPAATDIGTYAFQDCSALTSAYLPAATSIGTEAFYFCTALASISLPAATDIGEKAFDNCTALTSAYLPAATDIGTYAFQNCSALTSAYLPAATDIKESAFYVCEALTSVSLPAAKTVGGDAFYYCTALTSISLPEATSIGTEAFYVCKALTSVSLPAATGIGTDAFSFCEALTSVSLPAATSIGKQAFSYCSKLVSLDISGVTQISDTDGLNSGAFTNFRNSKNCALVLNEAMRNSTTDTDGDGKPDTFCNLKWKSITFKQP